MKNVLPPVIENLLKVARKYSKAYHRDSDIQIVVRAVEEYKKQLDYQYRQQLERDLISLMIRSSGDRSVGVNKEEIEVRMWRGYIRPDDSLRKEVKELFADAAEALFETSLGDVRFEDECADCGAILNSKKCNCT